MRLSTAIPAPVLAITATGFVATVAQIIIVRELLVLFYGNELSAGFIFAGWLVWSALGSGLCAKWALKISAQVNLLRLMLVGLAVLLPLSVLFIRAARVIWLLPAGELPSIGTMLLISAAVTALFCPLSGALFGTCWAIDRRNKSHPSLAVYLGEALGSAAGGLSFYFLFLSFGSVFTSVWLTAGIALLISGWLFRPWWPIERVRFGHWCWIAVSILIAAGTVFGSLLDQSSRRWQWGPNLSAVHDTAYHNIALVKKGDQLSVFTNGLWLFSEPDRLSAEYGVHLALLQHPDPTTVLVLGGGVAGLLDELLKQPGLISVDYVEPDSEFIDFLAPHLSPATNASFQDRRVRLFHQDSRSFMRRSQARYDVILMNMGDPITAQMNRFYSTEFFHLVKKRLSCGGIFSFAVSGGESMLGPSQARFLGSIKKTLGQVFPDTLVYPGDQMRFFAADRIGVLLSDPAVLANRRDERNLKLTYIRKEILQDALSPLRLDYLNAVLESVPEAAVNRDFYPIGYFHTLMMWAVQWHEGLQEFLLFLAGVKLRWLWVAVAVAGAAAVVFFWTGRSKFTAAVAGSVCASGAVEMVLQVNLLLGFQIIEGFVYRQLALIIAFFMAGLAVGAGWVSRKARYQPAGKTLRIRFIGVQAVICMLPFGLMLFFQLMQAEIRHVLTPAAVGWLFSGISLIIGVLGGFHFALAVGVIAAAGVAVEKIGGSFYALDLAGAAAGVLIAAGLIIPIYGIIHTLAFLGMLSAISLVTLLRQ